MPSSALLPFLLLVFFATLTIVGVAMVALDKSERELKKEHPELIEGIEPSDSYFGHKFPYIHAVRIKNRLALKQMQEAEDKPRVSWVINQENPVPRLASDAAFTENTLFGIAGFCFIFFTLILMGKVPKEWQADWSLFPFLLLSIVTAIFGAKYASKADKLRKPQILKSINSMEFHPKMQDGSIAHIRLQIQLIESEWTQHVSDRLHSDLSAFFAGSFAELSTLPNFQILEKAVIPTLETAYSELGLNLLRHKVMSIEQEKKKVAAASPNEPGILF